MSSGTVTIHVRISAKILYQFSLFDTFVLRSRWKAPVLFAGIFSAFSAAAFLLRDKAQSALIGTLLLCVGLGLPLAYLLHFLLQVHDQVRLLGLKTPKAAYTLNLGQDVRIINDMKNERQLTLTWDSIHGAWRVRGAYYLYVTPSQAFILPDAQLPLSPADAWAFFTDHLGASRLHGRKP